MNGLKRRYRALPLFASPLEQHEHEHHHDHEAPTYNQESKASSILGTGGKLGPQNTTHALTTGHHHHFPPPDHVPEFATEHDAPAFREREEASSIELFYDLFFVANLSSFTSAHPIDTSDSVKSYIGFFALLWFNWLQVTLYDVRFGVDSVFERTCKALHLGIMIAFAVVGTNFDPSVTGEKYDVFRKFALILMISKLILVTQYSYILIWVKGHPKILKPLAIHIASLFIGAVVCAGLIPAFQDGVNTRAYVGFYIVAVIEAIAIFGSSSQWRSVSFKHTNLNERVGLLTLIILGEGIIVLSKSMSYVTKGYNYSPTIIGAIISVVIIIYSLYMLYFDQVDAKRFGTIRQQVWALMHLPFHIALVLFLEGTSRFVTWRNGLEQMDYLDYEIYNYYYTTNTTADLADTLNSFSGGLLDIYESPAKYYTDASKYIEDLANQTDILSDSTYTDVDDLSYTLIEAMFKFFNIKAPKDENKAATNIEGSYKHKDPTEAYVKILHVYDLVFHYFFIAAGCTLIMMAILILVAKKKKCAGDWAAIALRAAVGTGVAAIAAMSRYPTFQVNFLWSGWLLPTAAIAMALVVGIDGVLGYILPAPPKDEGEGHGHGHGGEGH